MRNDFISTGVLVIAIALGVETAAAAQLSAEDHAALAKFAGVWDVQPAPRPGGPGAPPTGGRIGQNGAPPGPGQRIGQNGGPPGPGGPNGRNAGLSPPDIPGLEGGDLNVYRQMTPVGRAAFDAMDPRELPQNNCRSGGVPTLAVIPFSTQDWSFDGDVLTIHHSEFDTVRQITFDGRAAEGPPTQLGHATGTFDNGVLTITTTHMTASSGALSRNAPGSEARTVTERYSLADGGQGMRVAITVDDPLYLTHALTLRRSLVRAPEGTEVESFPCDVEASQRHLDVPE